MLRLVSTSSSTREFRTTSRSDRQCGCKNRISRPKKVAVRSAVKQPAEPRAQLDGVAAIQIADEQQNGDARRDRQNPIGVRLDPSPLERRVRDAVGRTAAGSGSSCGASLRQRAAPSAGW